MPVNWRNYIVSTPEILPGKPLIKATRIPVRLILGYFAAGGPQTKSLLPFQISKQRRFMLALIMHAT